MITEDEAEGFLIDLDHAIRVDRESASGANGRTGTKVFMSIGLLLQGDSQDKLPHSFMDDLESMFWLLYWICIHNEGPANDMRSRKSTSAEPPPLVTDKEKEHCPQMDLTPILGAVEVGEGIKDGGKAIALGVGAGLGSIGAGIGVGFIFGKEIESVARQPEMKSELESIRWLGFALTEAVAFYTFIFGLIAFFLS
jgi:F-type H+-transporting ATPase subunit c